MYRIWCFQMQATVYNLMKSAKQRQKEYIIFAALLIQCLIITMFSSQIASVSSQTSSTIVDIIKRIVAVLPIKNTDAIEFNLTYLVRKGAHFYNFTVVGIFIFMLSRVQESGGVKIIPLLGMGLFAAVFDEVHQYFVPGRSAQLSDMMIDFSGVLFGVCAAYTVLGLIFIWRKNEKGQDC